MSQADELLNSLSDGTIEAEKEYIIINKDRSITVPDSLKKIAVQYDHNVETVTFKCPRYCDEDVNNHDLSTMNIYVNYRRIDGEKGSVPVDAGSVKIDETDDTIMYFNWTISKNVTAVSGFLAFSVCVKRMEIEEDGFKEINHWNSQINNDLYVTEGLEANQQIVEDSSDIIEGIISKLNSMDVTSTPAVFQGTEADYTAAEDAGLIQVGQFVYITSSDGDGQLVYVNGRAIEVATAEEMDTILSGATDANEGLIYLYTGETTDKYENGLYYTIAEEEEE